MSYIDILLMFLTPTPIDELYWVKGEYPEWWVRTGLEVFSYDQDFSYI